MIRNSLHLLVPFILVHVSQSFLPQSTRGRGVLCSQSLSPSPVLCRDGASASSSLSLSALPDEPYTERRKKKNKYAKFSKADKIEADPLEALISESNKKNQKIKDEVAKKKNKKVELDEETLQAMKMEKRDRDKRIFPDNSSIDPYDPTTYGYTELGTIMGPHGVHGLMKIAAVTDFPERLCKPGLRHLKAPSRRSPREVRLVEGRHRLKNEYLIKLEDISDRNEALRLRGSVLYARQEERPDDLEEDEFLVTDLVGLDVHLVTGYGEDYIEDYEDDDDDDYDDDYDDDDDTNDVDGDEALEDDDIDDWDDANNENSVSGKFVGIVRGVVLAEEMCATPGLGQDFLEITLPRGKNGTPSFKDEMVLIPLVPSIVPSVDIEERIIYIDPPGGLLDLTYVKEEVVRIKGFLPVKSSYEKNKNK